MYKYYYYKLLKNKIQVTNLFLYRKFELWQVEIIDFQPV